MPIWMSIGGFVLTLFNIFCGVTETEEEKKDKLQIDANFICNGDDYLLSNQGVLYQRAEGAGGHDQREHFR